MNKAIYPGSFDPITLGHVNIITRALEFFDELVVLLAVNPVKKALFTVEENLEMIQDVTSSWPQVTVDSTQGLLVDYARQYGITKAVRGLRGVTDFDTEFAMALTNRSLWSEFDTVYLVTDAKFMYLHSSVVRQVAALGGDVSGFVSPLVEQRLRVKLGSI
ncbi:MAG: pantetheine-phosphate adenylyltransferase [Candidatus Latescibacterota bacterium]|nr:pantetheine-phosphate adenylyltransferase [Candidatus Latescibacterota bacterium]